VVGVQHRELPRGIHQTSTPISNIEDIDHNNNNEQLIDNNLDVSVLNRGPK
jgi:hypothetical protein